MDWDKIGAFVTMWLVGLLILAVIFLVLREFICWYWKINQTIGLLTEIRDLLAASRGPVGATAPSTTTASIDQVSVPVRVQIDETRFTRQQINAVRQMVVSKYTLDEMSSIFTKAGRLTWTMRWRSPS